MDCPNCGAPIKEVPAGVSKRTGKPYDAFQACTAECGWHPAKKEGYTARIVENHHSSKVPETSNGLREKAMIMSYAKDIVVALIARDQVIEAPGKECVDIYNTLIAGLK